jgi:hypothetical protein
MAALGVRKVSERAVYKSTAAEFLDEMFSGTAEELRTAYNDSLALLEQTAGGSLSEAAAELADDGVLPDGIGDVDTFFADWLDEDGQMAGQHAGLLMRHGYEQAIRLALRDGDPVPIETLWVTGAGDEFEIHICEGKERVTVVMFIPLVRLYGSERAFTRSWVVRVGAPKATDDAVSLAEGDPPVTKVRMSGARSVAS